MFNRALFICAAVVMIAFSGTSGTAAVDPEYTVPELTPAQKEADFRYLTDLVRDQWPFAVFNVRYKGLIDLNAQAEEYIARAKASKNKVEFYAVFREYLQELQQTGHAYMVSPVVAAAMDDPMSKFIYKLQDKPFARVNYWWRFEQNLNDPVHALMNVYYQDGRYIVLTEHAADEAKIPAGSIVQEVNGMAVDQYVLSLQNKAWLAFDAKLMKVYRPELFAVDPGLLEKGWQVRFELPNGADISAEIPKIHGLKSMFARSFYGNAHCVELNAETGYIRIFSFTGDIANDFRVIQSFMQKSQGRYKKLIIDIRGNGGGSPVYFMDNLIAPLLKKPVVYEQIGALRRKFTEIMQDQLKVYQDLRGDMISEAYHCVKWEELPEAPGLDAADWRFFKVTRRIEPKNGFPFDGRVYLLTNPWAFSASDDFAETVKSIGLAKIVGTNASGGAAHFVAPVYMALPESGIFFRLEMELALNPDGTPEEIFGTAPDVWLPETTPGNSYERKDLLQDPWVQWVLQD